MEVLFCGTIGLGSFEGLDFVHATLSQYQSVVGELSIRVLQSLTVLIEFLKMSNVWTRADFSVLTDHLNQIEETEFNLVAWKLSVGQATTSPVRHTRQKVSFDKDTFIVSRAPRNTRDTDAVTGSSWDLTESKGDLLVTKDFEGVCKYFVSISISCHCQDAQRCDSVSRLADDYQQNNVVEVSIISI